MTRARTIAACSKSVQAMSFGDLVSGIGSGVENMIRIQMTAYPNDWSDEDKREMAQQHLFGRGDQPLDNQGEGL
jgi:hypothetical protein